LAFISTFIATKNIIITIITIFSVGMVIISVIGIMNILGWDIGVTESLSMVIMIGLSIDYILHLSVDYMHSPL
jgi:predicted RND superfamily exporter protein